MKWGLAVLAQTYEFIVYILNIYRCTVTHFNLLSCLFKLRSEATFIQEVFKETSFANIAGS